MKRGTLQIDECKLSLATQKDPKRLVAAIIVEEEGTLLVSRTEILGAAGTIGIYCNGGKVALRETIFKEHAIGVLVNGSKLTSIIAKNCIFQRCVHGVVLNGPYAGSV